MTVHALVRAFVVASLVIAGSSVRAEETIEIRIASGQSSANTYVSLMKNFFVSEVTKRVADRTKYRVKFVEGYGSTLVKPSDALEAVQSGIIDIGGYCFCHEPSNLPLHAFQIMLPFGPMSPLMSLKVARTVYDKVPYMTKVFEDKYQQKLIALVADSGYNLGTDFEWNNLSDLKGKRIAGAGLNLMWLEFVGAETVLSSLPEVYKSMQTGVYHGWIALTASWINFKLYEVGKYYTEVSFGAITWHGLTINTARWEKLPKEVQDIILKVAKEYEVKTATTNEENYPKQLEEMRKRGVHVRKLSEKVRLEWARLLAAWPVEKAKELDAKGLPATKVLETALAAAERAGYKWPIHYKIR